MSQQARHDVNGKTATGLGGHMLQDESKDLSKWLASKPDAMRLAREAASRAARKEQP